MEFINRASSQLHELYRSLTPGGRLTAGLLAAVVVLGLAYAGTHQASGPDADLMRGVPVAAGQLPPMEAAFAKANLTGYEIRGNSIFVPKGQESAYMAALVKENALPPNYGAYMNGAGSASSPWDSKDQRELRIRIATQNELALQICDMPGIERASVLYAVDDKPGGFKDKVITATVSVKPVGTNQLEESRVSAIRHHVAGAIAGLKPENVTVSDLNGPTWHGNWQKQNPGAASATGQIAAPAKVDHHRTEESAKPKTASEPQAGDLAQDAWHWLTQSWRTVALIGGALVCLLVLRSMVCPQAAIAKVQVASDESGPDDATTGARAGKVPPPHWRRTARDAGATVHEELSALVQDDPETAASILRNWIGQVS
jgi:flagellar biosynthesis/type III secretory pathway M-ring protein FliF/YscJ